MRILHVAESIRGGCGTYLNQTVPQQIDELGRESIWLVVPFEHRSMLQDVPSERTSYFARPRRSIVSLFLLGKETLGQVKKIKPDVIHVHSTFAGAVVRLMLGWRRKRPKIVYCPHGWVFDVRSSGLKRRMMKAAEKMLSGLCDAIVAISDYEAEEARRIGIKGNRVFVVKNGLKFTPPKAVPSAWSDERRKALFIGRLDEQKGFDVLVKAVEGCEDEVALRVIGESVLGEEAIPTTSLRSAEFLGWQTEGQIEGHLAVADFVVMPSRWEGFGLVAIEAMRASKAVIASRVGGLQEVVVDGETGILVPADDPAALRGAILSTGHDEFERLGAAGRRRFEQSFTIEKTHTLLMQLYRQITTQGPSTAI